MAAATTAATTPTPIATNDQLGSEMDPRPDFPAHAKNTSISTRCTVTPATELSPTLEAATGASTPDFCKYRTLSAMPPKPAGARLLANDAATCANNVGMARRRAGTAPPMPSAAPT